MSSLADLPTRFFNGQDQLKGPIPPELVTPDYKAEIVGFPPMNAGAHSDFGRAFYTAFPDLSHTIDETIVAGDKVVTRFTLRGTHQAAFMGIPATGRPIEVSAIAILSTEQERVSHLRAIFDRLGMMRQLAAGPG